MAGGLLTAIKAAHRTKRQADSLGTVAFVLLWHGNTRDVGFNGVNGRSGARMGGDFFVVAMIFFVLRCAIETATGSFFRYRTGFLWV